MKDRIKQIRKYFKKTQAEFGADINVSKPAVQSYEYGNANITDRTIADICRVYGVNETWLRSGEGEMFAPETREQEVAKITAMIIKEPSSFRTKLIKTLAQMNEEELKVFEKVVKELAKED